MKYELVSGRRYTRTMLANMWDMGDREVRVKIRHLRRQGVPIMAVHGGGYKIAETPEEKRELLQMYRSRAMDELKTYSALVNSMQIDGQTDMTVLLEVMSETSG